MKKGPREWLEQPRVIFPLFGVAFAIPFIFAQSDRAAAFAGGLASGIAAVIAVVLSAQFQRDNELDRERRAKASDLLALATEFSVYLAPQAYSLKMQADELKRQISPPPSPFSYSIRSPQKQTIVVTKESVLAALIPLPQRLLAQVGQLDRRTAQAIIGYAKLSAELFGQISDERNQGYTAGAVFGNFTAHRLGPKLEGLAKCAKEAFDLVDAYVSKVSDPH